ncbi:hypothetical protein [Inhella sp.]|uniref:hypothetical protein n=1 Tax=Inhella sp. TaxID=1921806 RepID=UPI0035AF3EA0
MGRRAEHWISGITASDVTGREEATRLAQKDIKSAFAVARKIVHPWYRCQALTAVALELANLRERKSALMEAFAAAYEQDEPNRITCASAWPLRALVPIDLAGARQQVIRLLAIISAEPHGLRRLDGLFGLLGAVLDSAELRALVLPAFFLAAESSSGWRSERLVAHMALALGRVDPIAARALLEGRTANRFTSKALAALNTAALR